MNFSLGRYSHAEKIWNFLRYDRSNQFVFEHENLINKTESCFGPIPLYKWPDCKVPQSEETILVNLNVNKVFIVFF